MKTQDYLGCWLDGGFPRTPQERIQRLLDVANSWGLPEDRIKHYEQEVDTILADPDTAEFIYELEDELINEMEKLLPEGLTIVLGDPSPGDVCVIENTED